ncbi:hypothetical protein HZC27_01095 [Candidatus Roizmanbacteria bacterium]|nr:hypothetical protein [Candidatus Roizmanbacteria bacterium]
MLTHGKLCISKKGLFLVFIGILIGGVIIGVNSFVINNRYTVNNRASGPSEGLRPIPTPPAWGPIPCISKYLSNTYAIRYGGCFAPPEDSHTYYCRDCTKSILGENARYNCLETDSEMCPIPEKRFNCLDPNYTHREECINNVIVVPSWYVRLARLLVSNIKNIDAYVLDEENATKARATILGYAASYFGEGNINKVGLNIRIVISCSSPEEQEIVNGGTDRYVIHFQEGSICGSNSPASVFEQVIPTKGG